jgi:hypothetical protein
VSPHQPFEDYAGSLDVSTRFPEKSGVRFADSLARLPERFENVTGSPEDSGGFEPKRSSSENASSCGVGVGKCVAGIGSSFRCFHPGNAGRKRGMKPAVPTLIRGR